MKQISVKLPDRDYENLLLIKKELEDRLSNMFEITLTDAIRWCIATTTDHDLQLVEKEDLSE